MARAHGTRARYDVDRCRCVDCRAANNAAQRTWQRRKAQERFGSYQFYVDAEPVRQHLRMLSAAGLGWKRVAVLSGVPTGAVSRLLYGLNGRRPSTKVRPETARKILAITTDQAADGARVDATGTRRRLQALVAVGWSGSELMRRLGKIPTNFGTTLGQPTVEAATARAVRALYDELWDQQSPTGTAQLRAATARSRAFAGRRGWAPPLAWDDDTIDDPAAEPDTGERGPVGVDLAEVDHLLAGGCSIHEIARRMDVATATITTARWRAKGRAS